MPHFNISESTSYFNDGSCNGDVFPPFKAQEFPWPCDKLIREFTVGSNNNIKRKRPKKTRSLSVLYKILKRGVRDIRLQKLVLKKQVEEWIEERAVTVMAL